MPTNNYSLHKKDIKSSLMQTINWISDHIFFLALNTKDFSCTKSFHLQLRRFSDVLSWEMVRKIVLPILIRTGKFIIFSLGLSVITFISKLFNLITFLSFKLVCISPKTFINQNFINSVLKPKKNSTQRVWNHNLNTIFLNF